jgi:hypothetical protein
MSKTHRNRECEGTIIGASGWDYFTAYDDIAGALAALRQRVYDSGEFYREENGGDAELTEVEFIASIGGLGDDESGMKEFMLDEWRQEGRRPQATDPDSLLASQPASGTHSIIDIADGVSEQPMMFTTAPLTDDELMAAFGTTQPSSDAVRAWAATDSISGVRSSWSGAHVITYLDGQPHEIAFVGYSGD